MTPHTSDAGTSLEAAHGEEADRSDAAPTRRRIGRTERLDVAALAPQERRTLADRLFAVYAETVSGLTREDFDAEVFGSEETRLALFHGEDGEFAGFSYARIDRLEHDGRTHAVFGAGVYVRLAYKGGTESGLFGLTEALRFKLREPRTPLAYLTRSASPAVYRLLASTMPVVYPHPVRLLPRQVEGLVAAANERRRYRPVADDPWVVHSIAVPVRPGRLRSLETDPFAAFYRLKNPTFAEGTALLVWIPLDLGNIARGLFRLGLRSVGR